MPFDARRYPNALTIRDLITERMGMGVHCQKCGRHVVLDPDTLHLLPGDARPVARGPLQMHVLRPRQTEARPERPGRYG